MNDEHQLRELRRYFDLGVDAGHFNLRREAKTEREIRDQLDLAQRHLAAARLAELQELFPGAAFSKAYDACIVVANALIAALGYRASGDAGHEEVLRASEQIVHALGDTTTEATLNTVREWFRDLRHMTQYRSAHIVEPADLEHALLIAADLTTRLGDVAKRLLAVGYDVAAESVPERHLRDRRIRPARAAKASNPHGQDG